jgi:transposase
MPSKIAPHDTPEKLSRLARLKENAGICERLHAIRLLMDRMSPVKAAAVMSRSSSWVHKWRRRYNEQGVPGLWDKPRSGQPKKLGDKGRERLRELVEAGPDMKTDGVSTWDGEAVGRLVEREFGVVYSLSQIYEILHVLGLSWVTSRPKHPRSDPQEQKRWKEETLPSRSAKSRRSTRKKR